MTTRVGIWDDKAIVIHGETDLDGGVVIGTIVDAARLITALSTAMTHHHGEDAWRRAKMRVLMEAAATEDWPPE